MKPLLLLAIAAGLCLAGSSVAAQDRIETSSARDSQTVSLQQTPAAVRQQFSKLESVASLRSIRKQMRGDMPVYDATFRQRNSETEFAVLESGRPISLRISGTGQQVNEPAGAQRRATFAQEDAAPTANQAGELPQAVRNTLQQQLGSAQIRSVEANPLYDITLVNNQGRQQKARIAADGTLLDFQQLPAPAANQQAAPR